MKEKKATQIYRITHELNVKGIQRDKNGITKRFQVSFIQFVCSFSWTERDVMQGTLNSAYVGVHTYKDTGVNFFYFRFFSAFSF